MYKLVKDRITNENSSVLRLDDGVSIPFDQDNTDYQAYLRWCEEGNTPEPADQEQA